LEQYCVEQCPTPKCPHREATSVALPILPSPPYAIAYGLVLANGYRKDMVDVQQQGVSTEWKSSGETLKPSCKRNTRIGLRVSKKTRRSSKRLPTDKETGRAGGSRSSTRRCVDDRSIIGLSSKSDVGTRSTSRRCYIQACNVETEILEGEFDSVKNNIHIVEARLRTEKQIIHSEVSGVGSQMTLPQAVLQEVRLGIGILQSQEIQILEDATSMFSGINQQLQSLSK